MLSPLEQLARYEKNNRHMFLVGYFFVLLVVAFWILAALNSEDISRLILNPGPQERQSLSQLKVSFPEPSLREKALLTFCETLIVIPAAIAKVFAVRFVTTLMLIIGALAIGFSQYGKRVLRVAREALETK